MRQKLWRAPSRRVATLLGAGLALTAFGSGLASSSAEPVKRGAGADATVFIRDGRTIGQLRFVGPEAVQTGDSLRVINKSRPRRVGPHTFSLVTRASLPKTRPQRRACFAPNRICREIAQWHGSNGNTPPTINPAEAGKKGWDVMGNATRKGDSWFTGNRPNTSITQNVSVDNPDTPTRLFYFCAIHPWMKGSFKVLPRGGA
jgi:hypothetical protein